MQISYETRAFEGIDARQLADNFTPEFILSSPAPLIQQCPCLQNLVNVYRVYFIFFSILTSSLTYVGRKIDFTVSVFFIPELKHTLEILLSIL